MVQSAKKITEHWVSLGSWKSGAGWNNVLHIKHNGQIHCPSVSIDWAGCLYVQLLSAPYILSLCFSVTMSSTPALGHLFNACRIPAIWVNKKKTCPSIILLARDPTNVLRGQVAAGTTYCRRVIRWIEVLVVWLQCETLYGCTENFRVPNSLSEYSVAARHVVLLSLTGL